MLYTTKQIARTAQVSERWVQKICKRLGVEKLGRDYLVDQFKVLDIIKEIHRG